MTLAPDELGEVLEHYSRAIGAAQDLDSRPITSGFSGARIWCLRGRDRAWVLRRWPDEYDHDRLKWIHRVLTDLPNSLPIPIPLRAIDGHTIVKRRDFLWTLEPWMPGASTYWREPSNEKLIAAVQAMAAFHTAVQTWSHEPAQVPAIVDRIVAVRQHIEALGDYETAILNSTSEWSSICREVFAESRRQIHHWQRALRECESVQTVLIPCIRDLWHDHVLFTGNRVTGLVDFGGMRLDSIATDLARLVGSLVGVDAGAWRLALEEYQRAATLPVADARLIPVIDGSSICIAGLNWVRWLIIEHRVFENSAAVSARLNRILHRLQTERIAEIQ